jgi:hypothetical protein
MCRLRRDVAPEAGRLLRVLLLWLGGVPADSRRGVWEDRSLLYVTAQMPHLSLPAGPGIDFAGSRSGSEGVGYAKRQGRVLRRGDSEAI